MVDAYGKIDNEAPVIVAEAKDYDTNYINRTLAVFESWLEHNGSTMAFDECDQSGVSWHTIPSNQNLDCNSEAQSILVEFIATDRYGNSSSTTASFIINNTQKEEIDPDDLCSDQNAEENELLLFQNAPNPFLDKTDIRFYTPKDDKLSFGLANLFIFSKNLRKC